MKRTKLLDDPKEGRRGIPVANIATRSYKACRCGLEQPQVGTDFWRTFSGAGFRMEGVTPESGRGPYLEIPITTQLCCVHTSHAACSMASVCGLHLPWAVSPV